MLWDGCMRPLRVQKYSPTDNILTKFLHPASLQILNPATIINKKAPRPEAQVGGNFHEGSRVRGTIRFLCVSCSRRTLKAVLLFGTYGHK